MRHFKHKNIRNQRHLTYFWEQVQNAPGQQVLTLRVIRIKILQLSVEKVTAVTF